MSLIASCTAASTSLSYIVSNITFYFRNRLLSVRIPTSFLMCPPTASLTFPFVVTVIQRNHSGDLSAGSKVKCLQIIKTRFSLP